MARLASLLTFIATALLPLSQGVAIFDALRGDVIDYENDDGAKVAASLNHLVLQR